MTQRTDTAKIAAEKLDSVLAMLVAREQVADVRCRSAYQDVVKNRQADSAVIRDLAAGYDEAATRWAEADTAMRNARAIIES